MKTLLLFLAISASLAAADNTISFLGHSWTVQDPADWKIEGNVLQLIRSAEPPPGVPRRPQKFALADLGPFRRVTVTADVRRNGRSVIIIYAWQDANHFNYAHISSDTAEAQNVHNGMFHVFKGERVRMSPLDGPASLPTKDWTPVKLVFDGVTGRCYVEVNGKRNPSLDAVDLSLRWGRVGFGSFDETGDFRNIKIEGESWNSGTVGHQ